MSYTQASEETLVAEVEPILTNALDGIANKLYNYRTSSNLSRTVHVTTVRVRPEVSGLSHTIELGIGLLAQYDTNDPDSMREAERDIGRMSGAVYSALHAVKHGSDNSWIRISFDRPWTRPPNNPDIAQVRLGECFATFHMM